MQTPGVEIIGTFCTSAEDGQQLELREVILARLRLAKFYLSTTDQSIQSLAALCGYESDLHFMKQFKKNMNMTPSQYRASCR